jgi:hypothetical protein
MKEQSSKLLPLTREEQRRLGELIDKLKIEALLRQEKIMCCCLAPSGLFKDKNCLYFKYEYAKSVIELVEEYGIPNRDYKESLDAIERYKDVEWEEMWGED